ncbi:MAG: PIG-L family deacetylase [Anaerolineae bacterium]|nr:PIG-L family deacetylase [Anaerolineae bacterium]
MLDLNTFFPGPILLTVPHMDDCVLGCGGLLALLPDKQQVHVLYATDGQGSPAPLLPWRDMADPQLGTIRVGEARRAMGLLGIPDENIYFLNLPDGHLRQHKVELQQQVEAALTRIQPAQLLIPFRYDRHPDHLALNHVLLDAHQQGRYTGQVVEYFIYHHWRLLPRQDVRAYIRPGHLLRLDISQVAGQKRAALACFTSQTTRFYPWQTRPNLTPQLLDAVSQAPEMFLPYDPAYPSHTIFTNAVTWIRLAHRLEPLLKKRKDQLVALWQRGLRR